MGKKSNSIIPMDKPLPEVEYRQAWEEPSAHLVRDASAQPYGWREQSGRRASELLLVPAIRAAVGAWREGGYAGASDTSRRLLNHWIEEDHLGADGAPLRFHFCQREAIETLMWAVEVFGQPDSRQLIEAHAAMSEQGNLLRQHLEFGVMDGGRMLTIEKQDARGTESRHYALPPKNLRRYAFKMATGAGKTWVMAMAVAWSYFHKLRESGSPMARNFLIVAPNVIVYQRLARDFAGNRIFNELPLIPPEWRGQFALRPHLRGEAPPLDGAGNLFLTNIQQLYAKHDAATSPVQTMLGGAVVKGKELDDGRTMRGNIFAAPDMLIINDEAHHVHDDKLAWNQSLLDIHGNLPQGAAAWLDFSATPKDQNGAYFVWTLTDYPLAQAVEDRIVKAPIIFEPTNLRDKEPEGINADNVAEKYAPWLTAAVARLREHETVYGQMGKKPVLFVMCEKTKYADALGRALRGQFGFSEDEVLVIHTDTKGEISKGELEQARAAAAQIDNDASAIKAIVSVLMLREGWDVKNVTVALGLRPFTAAAGILPEQVVGRGLRLMPGMDGAGAQTLETLGSPKLLQHLREQLELDGVSAISTATPPPPPVVVFVDHERLAYDIAVPLTEPRLHRDDSRLNEFDGAALEPLFELNAEGDVFHIRLRGEFATTQTDVHDTQTPFDSDGDIEKHLRGIVKTIVELVRLPARFSWIYGLTRAYLRERCFGETVELDDARIAAQLGLNERAEVAKYLARAIGELVAVRGEVKFENREFRLSGTPPFVWRRNLAPAPLRCQRTVFNYVATYNNYERDFARFLDGAGDVLRFAALGGTQFKVDYLKANGGIGFYFPDWVAVQRGAGGEVCWILETKGRVWEDTEVKDRAMAKWCADIGAATGQRWRFMRINQPDFETAKRGGMLAALEKIGKGLI